VPDRYRGETVKAFIVRKPGSDLSEDDVTSACAVELTAYKVPKIVEFRDELPRTVVGKVLRRVLLEEERAKAAAEEAETPASVPGGVARRGAGASPGAPEQEAATVAPAKSAAARRAAKAPAAPADGPVQRRRAGRQRNGRGKGAGQEGGREEGARA
jgi:hypothetical protein